MKTREEINEDLNDVGSSLYATLDPDYTHFFKKWQKKYDKYLDLDIDVVEVENIFLSDEEYFIINPKKSEIPQELKNKNINVSFVPLSSINPLIGQIDIMEEKPLSAVYKGYTYFKEEDIIFTKVTPSMENGNFVIAKNLINNLGFGSSEYHIVRCRKNIYNKLVWLFFRSDFLKEIAKKTMRGSGGLKRVPREFFDEQTIPIPKPYKNYTSYDIQKILVEFLKYNLDLVENYREKLNNIEADIAIMEDGLVPAIFDRDDDYIKRMFIKWNNDPVEPRDEKDMVDFTLEDIEFDNIDGVKSGEYFTIYNGQRITKKDVSNTKNNMLDPVEIYSASEFDNNIFGYIEYNTLMKIKPNQRVYQDKTILLNTGGSVGAIRFKNNSYKYTVIDNVIVYVSNNDVMIVDYLHYLLKSYVGSKKDNFDFSNTLRGDDLKKLNIKIFIPKPLTTKTKTYTSYEVQEAIVSFIDRFYRWKANVEKWIGILRSDLDAIENGYLYKTFKG